VSNHLRPLMEEQEVGMGHEEVGAEAPAGAGDGEQAGTQEGQEGHEVVENGAQPAAVEGPAVRAARDPGQPTHAERALHELTHLPFRPWCADCVAGKAADDPHRRLVREPDVGPPRVSVDYGFVTEGDETKTILVVKAAGSKAWAGACCRPTASPHRGPSSRT
jgi:hypothetical protein